MYETIEDAYECYLIACERHIAWLKEHNSSKLKRLLDALKGSTQTGNYLLIRNLKAMEIVLNLTEEEKQEHTL